MGYALSINADVVIFDTLTRWARIKPDQENDAGAAAEVMLPLEFMRGTANLAIMVVFHERKSGGDINDSMRGSSAYGGAADILLELKDPKTNGHANRRVLTSLGRFDDPGDWVIDWEDGEYVLQNSEDGLYVERSLIKKLIENYLDANGVLTNPALWEIFQSQTSLQTYRRALLDLAKEGKIVREGGGKRNDPHTYRLNPVSFHASQ